ncbi:hypothetical protein [Aquibacillus kalidii]|uniref:hypothetical protein n=1 Tax=Aquibacillus kalidii TaxID=2762597 RepID=UPI00164946CA|nr:hypothetical protein [Aquibacillus kalidii]
MFENVNFTPGQITYNDFFIDLNKPLDFIADGLKEDMFQVTYPKNLILDIGWYSGVEKFIIFIVKDDDWENPIKKIFCDDFNELSNNVEECTGYLRIILREL